MRVVANLTILSLELGIICAAAWLAYRHPIHFAAVTGALVLVTGWWLEYTRLRHEFPYYVNAAGKQTALQLIVFSLLASGESIVKAVLAAGAALLTFSGQDADRLAYFAILFALATFLGTSTLRRLTRTFDVRPSRWGYFRLAVPLGIVFAIAVQIIAAAGLVETKSLSQLASTLVFELPQQPTLAQLSQFLFDVKQTLDALIRTFLQRLIDPTYATLAGTIISLNVLMGLVIAIYSVIAAEIVRILEDRWLGVHARPPL